MGGLQGDGSYPHVGPDGDDGAVSNEPPRSQPGAWGIQDDVSSGEETGGGVLAIPQPAGRRSAGKAAGGRATSERCIICGDSSADVPWWSVGAVDMGDGTFQEGAKGSWCWLCGTTAEAWPLMTAEALAERHRGTPPFRAEFTAARHRAQRNQKQPGAAADMSVATRKTTGIRVAREVAFIELADAAAFFKQGMSRVSGLQIVRLPSPLGGQPEGIVVDMRDIPAGLVYSRVELFTTTVATLSNTVLAEGGGLFAGRACQGHLAVFGEPRNGCQAAATAAAGDGGPHRLHDPRREGLQDAGGVAFEGGRRAPAGRRGWRAGGPLAGRVHREPPCQRRAGAGGGRPSQGRRKKRACVPASAARPGAVPRAQQAFRLARRRWRNGPGGWETAPFSRPWIAMGAWPRV